MSWSRRLCVVASALLVLAAATDAMLQVSARPRVMGALARLAGTRVTVQRLHIGPLGGVHVRGLQAGPQLRVARLDLDLDLAALIEGRVRPTRVGIHGVRWDVTDGAASVLSWRDRAGLGGRDDGAAGGAGRAAIAVTATDIEVRYHGHRRDGLLQVGRIDGDLARAAVDFTARLVAAGSGPWRVRADEIRVHGASALAPPLRVDVSRGVVVLGGDPVAEALAASVNLDAGGGELRVSGRAPGDAARTVAVNARFGDDGGEGRVEARAFPLAPFATLLRPAGVLPERARAEAEVAVRWRGPLRAANDIGASGRVGVTDLGLRFARLAAQEVSGISATLDGSARLMGDAVEVDRAVLRTGEVQSLVRVSLTGIAGTPRLGVDATLDETPCQHLVTALPAGLAPALGGLEVTGTASARAHVGIDWARLGSIEHSETIDARGCRVVRDAPGADVAALRGAFRHRVSASSGQPREFVLGAPNPSYRPLGRMSRHVVSAFLTAEDRHFWRHGGFDPAMLGRALGHDLAVGRIEKG
ncbi:MAG TPA: transglycosylase domain-containing protein, partial [Polyangia bacterium]